MYNNKSQINGIKIDLKISVRYPKKTSIFNAQNIFSKIKIAIF